MTKASKSAKARVKRASMGEKSSIKKAARTLADYELITESRYMAIMRTLK